MQRDDLLLYAITDRGFHKDIPLSQQVEDAILGGVTIVQLREKELAGEELLKLAREVQLVCKKHGVPFIVNDDVKLAKEIDADGVHIGQSDMELMRARSILGNDKIIGVTAKTVEQARTAEAAGANYLGSGAVFGSSTKKDAKPMELSLFQEICESVSIPVVAIGGISAGNCMKIKGHKASGIAVISGIFEGTDICENAKRLCQLAKEIVE